MITDNLFLSICIPTYNRINKTLLLVTSILEYDGVDIEVVVLDNCSSDTTERVLGNIKDNRFKYIRNKESVGGMQNIITSLNYGNGEYVMLCLDKDRILGDKIKEFIDHLKKIDVVGGHCLLNTDNFGEDIIYDKGLESVLNFAYTSEHPSGLFVKNNILKQNEIIKKIVESHSTFSFLPELLKAEIAVYGRTSRINIPLVYTETLEECKKEVSHTYKGNNIYFFPKNIIIRLNIYSRSLFGLGISKNDKTIILKKIFSSLLIASTFGYKKIMKNKSICSHHAISIKNVSSKQLIVNAYNISIFFLTYSIPISIHIKIAICFRANFRLAYIILVNVFKKCLTIK